MRTDVVLLAEARKRPFITWSAVFMLNIIVVVTKVATRDRLLEDFPSAKMNEARGKTGGKVDKGIANRKKNDSLKKI